MIADAGMSADDMPTIGHLPGVSVHNVPSSSPAEIQAYWNGQGQLSVVCATAALVSHDEPEVNVSGAEMKPMKEYQPLQ